MKAAARDSWALGFVALAPLLALHDGSAAHADAQGRNLAQVLLSLSWSMLPAAAAVGWIVLACTTLACLVWLFHAEYALVPRLLAILKEAFLAALVMGPLLVALAWLLGIVEDMQALRMGEVGVPSLALVGLRMGGGAYEELLFRWLLYSLVYWLARRACLALSVGEDGATLSAELLAIAVSASAFAAAHLEGVVYCLTGWVGGEPYQPAIFAWRLLAGVLLAILFRWRGLGVAAWTHAFFNLALSIGAGVDVFL